MRKLLTHCRDEIASATSLAIAGVRNTPLQGMVEFGFIGLKLLTYSYASLVSTPQHRGVTQQATALD